MARFVRGLEGLFELAQTDAVETEGIGGPLQALALLDGDHAVFDDLGEDLFVVRLELAQRDLARQLALFEPGAMLE